MTASLRARLWLLLIVAAGAFLRFYNLGWGAPYYHFHIDEHVVFAAADAMTRSFREAAMSPKFFMYSPGPMYVLLVVRKLYEIAARHPLLLNAPRDEVTFMIMGRLISAAVGTATIPVVYAIARRIGGVRAGLLAAALVAFGVMHLRESHFFTVDIPMTFFSVVTLYALMRVLERGISLPRDVAVGAAFAAALLCKYTAVFLAPVIGLAYVLAAPSLDVAGMLRRAIRACVPGLIALVLFFVADPLPLLYWDKARTDIRDWVTAPLTGAWKPIWTAQFADVASPHLFWFTNLLWWGLGPAFELAGLAGVVWLFWKKERGAAVGAAFTVAYVLVAGRTITPFARYAVPLVPALAIAAGVLGSDLVAAPRRRLGLAVNWIVVGTTALWAAAYLHVFVAPDARLTASAWVLHHVPLGAKVLIEPSQNMVPFGEYLTRTDFNRDYLLRPSEHGGVRDDQYHFVALDTYVYLYDRHVPEDAKRAYIESRLAQVDYIVMDDTYLQFYQHLPEGPHAAVKKYYDDLFAGRLGFEQIKTFKVYPSLFGVQIDDDAAELTFRLFDHPRVFVFKRAGAPAFGG
ncbi:MAG TPA: glycosyltransferase family 39 protein [Vicinamibacterales bacterium]